MATHLELCAFYEMWRRAPGLCMHMCSGTHTRTHVLLALASSFSPVKAPTTIQFFEMSSGRIAYVLMNKYCQFPRGFCVFFFLFFCSSLYPLGALVWSKHHYISFTEMTLMLYNTALGKYCTTSTGYQLPPLASTTHTGDSCYFHGVIISPGSSFS